MSLSERDNFIRAVEFRHPEWIHVRGRILPAAWRRHRESLESIVIDHPRIFGVHERSSVDFDSLPEAYGGREYVRDNWGCLWRNAQPGFLGQVVEHPLADNRAFASYEPPDPDLKTDFGDRDWDECRERLDRARNRGLLAEGDGGRLFDLLYGLRGFENLMIDLIEGSGELRELLKLVLEHKVRLVEHWMDIGVDIVNFHGDIGTQRGSMISPALFRRHIKPLYREIFEICRTGGAHVFYSSDGNLLEIVEDLIECGVTLHDPQFRANTLEGIARTYRGKLCVLVDLDQQHILPFGDPETVRNHVAKVVNTLASPEGGLMVYAEIQPTYPVENIVALCEALEEHCLRGMPDPEPA